MRITFSLLIGLAASISTVPAHVEARQYQGGRILLRMKFAAHQVQHYRLVSLVSVPLPVEGQSALESFTVDTSTLIRQTVQDLLPEGGARVQTVVEKQDIYINRESRQPDPTPETITTFDALGRATQMKGSADSGGLPNLLGGANLGQYLPEQPVKPGDTWTYPVHVEGVSSGGTIKTTFLRYERVGPYRTARLHSVITLPIRADVGAIGGSGRTGKILSGSGSLEVDTDLAVSEGIVVRNTANGTMGLKVPGEESAGNRGAAPTAQTLDVRLNMSMNLVI